MRRPAAVEERRRPARQTRPSAAYDGWGGQRGIPEAVFGGRPKDVAALDAATIAAVRRAGANLALPRETRHYLYVPTEEIARDVAAQLDRQERTIEVGPAAMGDNWLVLVVETMVVGSESIARAREEFEAATAMPGGEYDGWEAAIPEMAAGSGQ